ncbi:MAG: glycosyltransferase family 4 protein [Verrucomicrobiota bacterium]
MPSRKKKLLIVSPTPPPMSGPEIMTRHLLNSSLRDGYELVHYNISKQRDIESKGRFDVVNLFFGFIQPFRLAWLLAVHRPAAMYTNLAQNAGGFLRYASFILVARVAACPVVTRVMGDGFGHFYRQAKWKWFIHWVVARIDRVIVRAELLKKQFEGIVPFEKIRVVYSGIEVKEFERDDLKESKDGKLTFLFVGYLTQAKGAFDLLRSLPQVHREVPELQFHFMGARMSKERNITYIDGAARPQNEVLNELMEDDAVKECATFVGVLRGEDKIREFVNADALVFPSHSEAFPTVVLEAMAAGLPIISTPVGVLPEAFDETEILFNAPGDVDALATSVIKLAKDGELRKKMGTTNHARVRGDFTIDRYGNRVRALFDELLGQETSSAP